MKKNILEEINRARTLMKLDLINENSQVILEQIATEITKLFSGAFKNTLKQEEKNLVNSFLVNTIKDDAKKAEFVTFMKSVEGKRFFKELKKAVDNMPDGLDKDGALRKLNSMKSAETQWTNISTRPGVSPGGTGSLPKIYQTYDEALKALEIEIEKVKSQYPKSFKGKNIGVGRQTIEQAARESVGKTPKEAIDIMNVRFAKLEADLPNAKPWFRKLIKSLDFRVKDATGKYSTPQSAKNLGKNVATGVAGIFIISALLDFGKRVSKLNDDHPEATIWQNMWISACQMIGVAVSTAISGGSAAIESGKEDYSRREKEPTNDENPPPPKEGPTKMRQINPDLIR